jgi:aspartyl protease family protein
MSEPSPQGRPPYLFWLLIALVTGGSVLLLAQGRSGNQLLGLEPNDFAQLFYLVVILIFVGSALLGRGLGAGEVVRSAAGWLAILLVLIGAYAYRDELTGVGARLLGVLAPGVPIPGRLAGEATTDSVMVVRSIDGHFAVRAELQSVPLTMMLDTGASFVTLTMDDAAAIGIDISALQFRLPVRTANGTINAAPVTLDTVSVGQITRERVPALVAPAGSLDQSLLGMSFLDTLHGYSIVGDRLVLTP